MFSSTTILWLTFNLLGQAGLLVVLLTFAFVKSLPQRKNTVLINFLLTTFLAGIPPTLLFITGQLNELPPKHLCLTQAVLMDGVAPMIGVALVVLVLQTWIDLRALFLGKIPITTKFPSLRSFLITAPYIALLSWCIASLAASMPIPAKLEVTQIIACANNSILGTRVRRFIGYFMFGFGIIEFSIEVCIGRLIYLHLSGSRAARKNGHKSYLVTYNFALRVFVFSLLELIPIILAALNSWLRLNSPPMKNATHILESMNTLATFLVFGTSRDLLHTWRNKLRLTRTMPILEIGSSPSMRERVSAEEVV